MMSHLPTLGGASGPPTPFPSAAATNLRVAGRRPRPIARGTVSDTSAVVFNGADLEVMCPRSGSRLAAWSFGGDDDRKRVGAKSSRDDSDSFGASLSSEITCVAEMTLSTPRGSAASHARRFVVAGTSSGLVGIIDVKSSQLVRALKLKNRVTFVTVVTNGSKASTDGDVVTSRIFHEVVQVFVGIIAVGTQEGNLYLIVSTSFLALSLSLKDIIESMRLNTKGH